LKWTWWLKGASELNSELRLVDLFDGNRNSRPAGRIVQFYAALPCNFIWSDDVPDPARRATHLTSAGKHRIGSDGTNIRSPLKQNKFFRDLTHALGAATTAPGRRSQAGEVASDAVEMFGDPVRNFIIDERIFTAPTADEFDLKIVLELPRCDGMGLPATRASNHPSVISHRPSPSFRVLAAASGTPDRATSSETKPWRAARASINSTAARSTS
jgi:hypothetical protein